MTLAFMDRSILALFVEPIRRDLQITDVQFSLLTGLAFALFYALCCIPVGRLIDSASRPLLLGVGVIVWSIATSLTCFADSFAVLFIARMAVGLGETTVSPASQSMATDMFIGSALARAISMVSLGVGVGNGLALLLGGAIASAVGPQGVEMPVIGQLATWQFTFLLFGLPGLVLGPIVLLTVKDPRRVRLALDEAGRIIRPSYAAVLRFAWTHRKTVVLNAAGYLLLSLAANAIAAWAPAHLIRKFNAPVQQVGLILGAGQMIATAAGIVCGGWLIDRGIARGRADSALRFSLAMSLCALTPMLAFPHLPDIVLSGAAIVLTNALIGAGYATVAISHQQLAPNQMRAQFAASYLVLSALMGQTLGPLLTPALNDALFERPEAIGTAASLVGAGGTLASMALLFLCLEPFRKSLGAVDANTHLPHGEEGVLRHVELPRRRSV